MARLQYSSRRLLIKRRIFKFAFTRTGRVLWSGRYTWVGGGGDQVPKRVMLTATSAKTDRVFWATVALLWQTKAFGSLILQTFLTNIYILYLRDRIFSWIENENHTSSSRLLLSPSMYINIYRILSNTSCRGGTRGGDELML